MERRNGAVFVRSTNLTDMTNTVEVTKCEVEDIQQLVVSIFTLMNTPNTSPEHVKNSNSAQPISAPQSTAVNPVVLAQISMPSSNIASAVYGLSSSTTNNTSLLGNPRYPNIISGLHGNQGIPPTGEPWLNMPPLRTSTIPISPTQNLSSTINLLKLTTPYHTNMLGNGKKVEFSQVSVRSKHRQK